MDKCSKCERYILEEKGLFIKTEKDELLLFCGPCLLEAEKVLSLKEKRTDDQQDLLDYIREFLKITKN